MSLVENFVSSYPYIAGFIGIILTTLIIIFTTKSYSFVFRKLRKLIRRIRSDPNEKESIVTKISPLVRFTLLLKFLHDPLDTWYKYSKPKELPCGCRALGKSISSFCEYHIGNNTSPEGYR